MHQPERFAEGKPPGYPRRYPSQTFMREINVITKSILIILICASTTYACPSGKQWNLWYAKPGNLQRRVLDSGCKFQLSGHKVSCTASAPVREASPVSDIEYTDRVKLVCRLPDGTLALGSTSYDSNGKLERDPIVFDWTTQMPEAS